MNITNKLYLISCTHLNKRADNTSPQIVDFIKYLNTIEDFTLLIIGDFIDYYQCKELDLIYNYNKELINNINLMAETNEVLFISGNHDPLQPLKEFVGKYLPNAIVIEDKEIVLNEKYIITHGDIFDPCFNNGSLICRKIIERSIYFYGRMEVLLEEIHVHLTDTSLENAFNNKIIKNAEMYAKQQNKIVIFGHTHVVKENELIKNIGCFVNQHSNYCVIEDGNVEVKEWK
jgi:UDP-2,3-diacylglucosamine pyrophosphatase LpxH